MATINSKIEGVDVLGVVTAGETIYVGRATSTQHGIVKPAATDFEFDNQTNAMLIKLGVGLKRTDDGIAIAIYDGNVVTDVLAVKDGLEIKYADIDEETENSKIIPWSEFTTAEIAYIKEHIGDWINIEPGTGEGAVQQIGAKATGPHSAAFGSRRYDKPTDESKRVTEAKGGNAFAAGGSVLADGDFTAAFGKETQAEQSASFAAGTKTQAGKTLEEYVAAGGNAEDYAKSYAAAAVFGDGNKAKGYADFVAGNANESDGTSNTTVGGANKVKGTRNFTGGEANEVGQSGSSDVGNALTFGQHLKNTGRWNRVTFGQFNADDLAALLEIGNGTSDTDRVNIFVVKDNGAIYAGKLGKLHQGTRFQVSDGNSENDRRALIDSRHNGVTHIESYMSTLNGSVGNSNKVAASESGELKDIADPTDGNYPLLNTFLAGQGLQNKGRFNQAVFGQFNEFDPLALFQVGTGNSDTDRKKGFRVDYAGRAKSDTAAAGDEFYVRVADLGEHFAFPFADPNNWIIDYDATSTGEGLTITGNLRIYVKKGLTDATSVYHDIPDAKISIPIKAGNGISIDKADGEEWLVVKATGGGGVSLPITFSGESPGAGSLGTIIQGTYTGGYPGAAMIHLEYGVYKILISPVQMQIQSSDGGHFRNLVLDATTGIVYNIDSNAYNILRQDTVKTLFGNQSIYGHGTIDLYRHNIRLSGVGINGGLRTVIISSKSTAIDSLTDLFTYADTSGDSIIPVTGILQGPVNGIAVNMKLTADGGIYYASNFTGTNNMAIWSNFANLIITDTVTTV